MRGLVALADGVRESTRLAVAQLRAAGVRVLVATGDHPETASAIAAEAGIPDADRVVTGAEFLRASDAERVRMVQENAVLARLSPEQKVALVAALHKAGATLLGRVAGPRERVHCGEQGVAADVRAAIAPRTAAAPSFAIAGRAPSTFPVISRRALVNSPCMSDRTSEATVRRSSEVGASAAADAAEAAFDADDDSAEGTEDATLRAGRGSAWWAWIYLTRFR